MLSKPSSHGAQRIGAFIVGVLLGAGPARSHEAEPTIEPQASGPYATAESAFVAVFIESGLGRRAYRENLEYAAALYQLADGSWRSTRVRVGTCDGSLIPYSWVPAAAVRIVGAHTHGQPRLAEDPDRVYGTDFSAADRRNAEHNFRLTQGRIGGQLLLSSELKILRLSRRSATRMAPAAPEQDASSPWTTETLGRIDQESGLLTAAAN